ncbi:hypothetical protein EVG20_g5280 [Dentipellis fragilis]|uniref:F-box domain-containing protein n=1 Tax=Dentipellis fragilis TaxID=205917 RepID=A0A4Y9YXF5_9AGAM|nr:hypothetical protein EVG20_g5280 [Dentipellis fragilis]
MQPAHQPIHRLRTDQMPSRGVSRHVAISEVPARTHRRPDMTSRLPYEILSNVFQPLDTRSLVNSGQVSRRWRTAIESSSTHGYDIALAAAGLHIGPPSRLLSSRRLRIIQDYERAWRVFPLGSCITIPKLPGDSLCVRASGNVVAQAILGERILSITRFFSLRLQVDGPPSTATYKMEESFDNFWVDAAQDLLVLGELFHQPQAGENILQLHIKCLSTAGAHRDTAVHSKSFTWTPFPSAEDRSHDVAIAGDHILIMCSEHGRRFEGRSSFMVWNWRVGETRLLLLVNEPAKCNFLDTHHVLVMDEFSGGHQILVYDLFTSRNAWTTERDALYCCRFILAPPDGDISWEIGVRTIASSTAFHTWDNSSVDNRYLPDSLIRLVVQDEDLCLDDEEDPVFRMIEFTISTSSLMRLVLSAPSPGHTYEWNKWGPGSTHVVDKEGMWCDEFAMAGTRTFHLERTDRKMYLHIRDFDRKRVQERIAGTSSADSDAGLQRSSILHELSPQSIRTARPLPHLYRKVRVPQLDHIKDPDYCNVLATEDAVILYRFSSVRQQDRFIIVLPLRSSLPE